MCRTVSSVVQSLICGVQMLTRVFITALLMVENIMRLLLQTIYNIVSFLLQMISLLPICMVFLVTSRLKCFMCSGGPPCHGGGTCDCFMSIVAIIIIYFILKATGLLDKIFYKIGYSKTKPLPFTRFVPTPGDITECSRTTETQSTTPFGDFSTTPFGDFSTSPFGDFSTTKTGTGTLTTLAGLAPTMLP